MGETNMTQMYPLVLANSGTTDANGKRPDMLERVADSAADGLTSATRLAGQLYAAFDPVHFNDGVKKQKLRSLQQRKEFWDGIAKQHGLTPQQLAAIIAS